MQITLMASVFVQYIRDHLRARHYSKRTEKTYVYWIVYYIRFHQYQHPSKLNEGNIVQFLEYLALERNVSPSTQKTALNALMYLYKKVFELEGFHVPEFTKARKEKKLPVVLTRSEVRCLFSHLQGDYLLCAQLMYGSGLRLMEVVRLRVKDVDLEKLCVYVMQGKGRKQRVTTLAESSCRAH